MTAAVSAREAAVTTTIPVTLADLRELFAGVRVPDDQPCGGGDWATTPCYSLTLAHEICRRIDPQTESQLRTAIYGPLEKDMLDPLALEAITLGFARYRMHRTLQGNRGL